VLAQGGGHPAASLFRLAMLVNGVDLSSKPGAIVSAAHTDADLDASADALAAAIGMLKEEGRL